MQNSTRNMIRNIVLIGSGKLATQLGMGLAKKGFNIRQVYSKTEENAEVLAEQLNAYFTDDLSQIQLDADLYIVAVKDDVLKQVIEGMPKVKGIVVHTAGSMSMDMLIRFNQYGIYYPFQTFSKEREVDFSNIPILIESNTAETQEALEFFGKKLSNTVLKCDSDQRKKIHLAAVFACNFSNHMYAIAHEILNDGEISFDVIKPLIMETALKTQELSPVKAQTGPAVRKDQNVINKHLKLLDGQKDLTLIYKELTNSIMKMHSDDN